MTPPESARGIGLAVDIALPPRLAHIAFAVAPGETLAITGDNGAGKSTLLAILAGLLRPASGTVSLEGRMLAADGVHVPPHRRGITLLGQGAPLFPHLSVLDNVAYAPKAAGAGRTAAREVARARLDEVGMLGFAARRPHELSGGQVRRVAIARALAADPAVLLLDEPLAAVDRTAAPGIRSLLESVLTGRLALLVTHDPDDLVLADRGLALDRGGLSPAPSPSSNGRESSLPRPDDDDSRPFGGPVVAAASLGTTMGDTMAAGIGAGTGAAGTAAMTTAGATTDAWEAGRARTPAEHRAAVELLLAGALAARPTMRVQVELIAESDRTYVLAEDATAAIAIPPFDNSQMDGYAVRSADLAAASADAPIELPVTGIVAAGDAPGILEAGGVAAIMTGAAVPVGADAIVPVEATRALDAGPRGFAEVGGGVSFTAPVASGTFVRRTGSDAEEGAVVLPPGTVLGAAQLGALSSAGVDAVEVHGRGPTVLLVSTGAELQPSGPLEPGRIRDSNRIALTSALVEAGADVRARTLTSDDPDELVALLAEGVADEHARIELVVTTGGVSAGAFEVVREALEPRGVVFGSVAMQPGGPQGLGLARLPRAHSDDPAAEVHVPVVAFPGNPVSCLVSFELFLRPALRAAVGLPAERPRAWAPLAEATASPTGKHQVRRGRLDEHGRVVFVGDASSHRIGSYAASTVLVHLPVGRDAFAAGEPVEIWRIDD
ncbi:gephyrin-like molybdotransferase Glp [Agromyces seonyuensis]|uniref:Molybdopterin molybdenumtransferase n=1 Tax=Agromyces seonyuensis TaxID=2662446 RepID=A0A6I4NTG4_9MICO|nr:gephyrin-like molybdotransferase Glp [Agromyces seonyuensis]MWB97523.1 ATP-binding cassette domain-containing protein [Agromyces seonyuensis]